MINYKQHLNEAQAEAVLYDEGPALVIAGAGSGKTRVLTYKLAHLLEEGYQPHRLMALTFTNKAAREMLQRIESMVGAKDAFRMKLGTFHSVFSRYLRVYAPLLGFTPNFSIYDTSDSKSLIKHIVKDLALDTTIYNPKLVLNTISYCKNNLIMPREYEAQMAADGCHYNRETPKMATVYATYLEQCRRANAMDFDDLLFYFNILLRDHPDVLEECIQSIDYLLIDEYQDTNPSQYLIVRRLAGTKQRIFAVGDDAQSIYSFRGACLQNILSFAQAFPTARLFKLEENYRSSQHIVALANSLIAHNAHRIEKEVFSNKEKGDKIDLYEFESGSREAEFVAESIYRQHRLHPERSLGDFAILYRTNAQSRLFENQLRQLGLPYRIYGGTAFYGRAEIKNILAYLQLVVNPHNNEAFERATKYPSKGIGDKSLALVRQAALDGDCSLYTATQRLLDSSVELSARTRKPLGAFIDLLEDITNNPMGESLEEWISSILLRSGILAQLQGDKTVEGRSRLDNTNEFVTSVQEFESASSDDEFFLAQADGDSLHEKMHSFLHGIALITDNVGETRDEADSVHLMTIHAAKGLEFDQVYIVGLEEGLFPSSMSLAEDNIEEERRLLYVAITRAKAHCCISYARYRTINGTTEYMLPSRFLRDLNPLYLKIHNTSVDLALTSRVNDFAPLPTISLDFSMETKDSNSSVQEDVISLPKRSRASRNPLIAPSQVGASGSKRAVPIPYSHRKDIRSKENEKGEKLTFAIGDVVVHRLFGKGVVELIVDKGKDTTLQVNFESSGVKTLIARFASLSKVSD